MMENTFKCIFETYKSRIYGFVLNMSHSSYAAEEITQEIFMKLWLCRDALDRINDMESYIFTMARNRTLNHLRKISTDATKLYELQRRMKNVSSNIEEHTTVSEINRLLREALDHLSPQRRKIYDLSRTEGLNHKQIAQQLELSPNTVKNHLVHSLRYIRDYLTRYNMAPIIFFLFFKNI